MNRIIDLVQAINYESGQFRKRHTIQQTMFNIITHYIKNKFQNKYFDNKPKLEGWNPHQPHKECNWFFIWINSSGTQHRTQFILIFELSKLIHSMNYQFCRKWDICLLFFINQDKKTSGQMTDDISEYVINTCMTYYMFQICYNCKFFFKVYASNSRLIYYLFIIKKKQFTE